MSRKQHNLTTNIYNRQPTDVQDIYAHFRNAEGMHGPSSDYMSKQSDINEKMRAILFDWLVEVHLKFRLKTETLYLT